MPKFSSTSKNKLEGCHPDLQVIFNEVIKYFDCTIVWGYRGEKVQNLAFRNGFSKVQYPWSKHNKTPAEAIDAVPYPIEWNNTNRMRFFAGFVMGVAFILKQEGKISHDIRTGIDWDRDTVLRDQRFNDYPHFEIVN